MRAITFLLSFIFLLNCSEEVPTTPTPEKLVVQAFIFAGQPVKDIFVAKAQPFSVGKRQSMPAVNDANVVLRKENMSYPLVPTRNDSGFYDGHYHYPGKDLTIESGDTLKLEISYRDQFITASTVVPRPVRYLSASVDTISADELLAIKGSIAIKFWWDDRGQKNPVYYAILENIEPEPVLIDSASLNKGRRSFSRLLFSPEFSVWYGSYLNFYGRYRVRVYNASPEFGYLGDIGIQDSRSLQGLPGNIENGLGIFAAFNGDSTFFYVKK